MNIEELLPFYALDALLPDEKAFVEAYLREHPERLAEVTEMATVIEALPLAADPIEPAAHVKQSLMNRISAEKAAQNASKVASVPAQQTTSWSDYIKSLFARPVFTGMAMAAAALAIIWGVSLFSQLDQQQTQLANLEATITAQDVQLSDIEASNESLTKRLEDTETTNVALTGRLEDVEAENEQLEGSNEALRQQLRDQENVLAIYNDPATQIVAVGGTEAQPEAIGRLTTSPSNNSLTFATNKLASLPTNEIYQLWLINDDGPVGMGIFSVNEDGMGEITIDLPEGIDTFTAVGVSIEPSGGSDQPTGDIVLLGSL